MIHWVILAGGKGERFWPLSGSDCPKPFWKWGKGPSFFQLALERTDSLSKMKWKEGKTLTWVVTERRYKPWIHAQAPHIPQQQILLEPVGRNTAAAIGWAAKTIIQKDPHAIMVCFPSDHWIYPIRSLAKTIRVAINEIDGKEALGLLGIRPTFPATGLGYIQLDSKLTPFRGACVVKFHEKPSLEQAKLWIRTGKYLWNSGIFVWRAKQILKELDRWVPDLTEHLTKRDYQKIHPISIDCSVLEKTNALFCVESPIEWNDLGTWENVWNFLPKDEHGNVLIEGNWVGCETQNSLIYSTIQLPVKTLGISNLIIVQTDRGVLICHRDKAQAVRQLLNCD